MRPRSPLLIAAVVIGKIVVMKLRRHI